MSLWALIALLYFFSPFILVVLGWFQEPFSDLGGAESVSHRVHEVLFGVLFAQAMAGAVSQLRKPIGARAGMLQTLFALAGLVAALAAIGEVEVLGLAFVALAITATVLHPAGRLGWKSSWHPHPGLLILALSGVLPLVLIAADNFAKAEVRAADHLTHWGGVAAFAIVQILLALTASLRPPGYRLVAGSVGAGGLVYFTASLLFPFDASARPQFFAAWLCLWSLSWLAVSITGRPPGSWIAGVGAAALIAVVAANGPAGIALGVFFGAVLVVLTRRGEGMPRFLAVGLGVLGYLVLVGGGVLAMDSGEPPSVPHGLVDGYEASTGQTCLDCHATGAEGATPIPHNPSRSCGEDEACWGGRVDCLGCHRYDPALGGPTQLVPPVLEASSLQLSAAFPKKVIGLTREQLAAADGLVADG